MSIDDIKEPSKEEQHQSILEQQKIIKEANVIIENSKNNTTKLKQSLQKNINVKLPSIEPEGWKKVVKDKFEIEIYEEITDDATGEIKGFKKVPSEYPIIIEASNKEELNEHAQRYAFCHQRMKIIRKLTDNIKQNIQNCDQNIEIDSPQQKYELDQNEQDQKYKQKPIIQKNEIKYYKIGDIDIKNDNGKIYQKQWLRLSKIEADNFRVINDKTNSIMNLTNKHIEMKKWIAIENIDGIDEIDILEGHLK